MMQQAELLSRAGEDQAVKRLGPPNRMNDLPYKEWMKFQKSFFNYESDQRLVEEAIHFFTKSVWPDGSPSRTLVLNFSHFDAVRVLSPRVVENVEELPSLAAIVDLLSQMVDNGCKYDYIMLDLRSCVRTRTQLREFCTNYADTMFRLIRLLLVDKRYCGVVMGTEGRGGAGFPLPWWVALAARDHLRLRDERIGILPDGRNVIYSLIMQAEDDRNLGRCLSSEQLGLADVNLEIPAWVIPTSPPRKKNEILHPAKYPEPLVESFIKLFSKPGDSVLDPMVGTGSSVVAALNTGRNGYGIDLSQEFVSIARERIEASKTLFDNLFERPKSLIVQGDSTKIMSIPDLRDIRFNYVVTSPPYWSMLNNPGSENQAARREKNLALVYSDNENDLGNVEDYDQFLILLTSVYEQVAKKLVDDGFLTVVVKNVKRNHILYTLAWDLVARLCDENGSYDYVGTTLWCQNDISIKPFAVGIHWVSNILHHYCLHFRKRVVQRGLL